MRHAKRTRRDVAPAGMIKGAVSAPASKGSSCVHKCVKHIEWSDEFSAPFAVPCRRYKQV
jgi:hypothetical protein